jgi:hypothetical protein
MCGMRAVRSNLGCGPRLLPLARSAVPSRIHVEAAYMRPVDMYTNTSISGGLGSVLQHCVYRYVSCCC